MTTEPLDTSHLTPANENPWYVLMTLHGEGMEAGNNSLAWAEKGFAPYHTSTPEEWRYYGILNAGGRSNWPTYDALFAERFEADGVEMPEDASPVTLKGVVFDQPLNLRKFAFKKPLTFEDCVFDAPVCFDNCLFNAGLTLRNVTFKKGLSMKDAGCNGPLQMVGVTSGAEVSLRGTRIAGAVKCSGFAAMTGTKAPISFKDARFEGFADFAEQTFSNYAVFEGATFDARAMFSRAVFAKGVSFRSTVFRDYAYFNSAKFAVTPNSASHHINFTESRFERPPTFRDATFTGEYPNLAGAILHDRTVFTADDKKWPRQSDLMPRAATATASSQKVATESAAILRALCTKQSLPEEEHFFFRREMEMAGTIDPWERGLPYRVFGLVSDYGHSIIRPANALLALWLWTILIYTEGAGLSVLEALGYSFSNMFKFLGLQRTYFDFADIRGWATWVQTASAAQTVLAFILLFFLGLGLRTRFRLR